MKKRISFGVLMFVIGFIIVMSSNFGITGYMVSDRIDITSSIFGAILVIGGLVFILLGLGRIEFNINEAIKGGVSLDDAIEEYRRIHDIQDPDYMFEEF